MYGKVSSTGCSASCDQPYKAEELALSEDIIVVIVG